MINVKKMINATLLFGALADKHRGISLAEIAGKIVEILPMLSVCKEYKEIADSKALSMMAGVISQDISEIVDSISKLEQELRKTKS